MTSKAYVDNETWNIGNRIDCNIFIITVCQSTKVDLQIVQEIWKPFVNNTCVTYNRENWSTKYTYIYFGMPVPRISCISWIKFIEQQDSRLDLIAV